MRLYFLRHGIAEDAHEGLSDAQRALTEPGRVQLRHTGRALRRLGLKPGIILTSPLVRAAQTAALIAPALEATVEQASELQPGCVLDDVQRLLSRYEYDTIVLVGHEPDFSTLAAQLIGAGEGALKLKKGGLIRVDMQGKLQAGRGHLAALLTPKLLRLMASASEK